LKIKRTHKQIVRYTHSHKERLYSTRSSVLNALKIIRLFGRNQKLKKQERGGRRQKGGAPPFINIKYVQNSSLEVVVNTECNVVTIEVYTPYVAVIICALSLNRLPTSETNVSYEAKLLVQVNSNTWLQTY